MAGLLFGFIPTDFESLSTIAFLVILMILIIRDRKNIEFKYGVFIRRTKKGREWIYYIGDKYKRFFGYFGRAAIIVGIIASFISFYLIFQYSYGIIKNPAQARPGLQLIVPAVPSAAVCSYVLCIPFWYWIIGILVVLLCHELSHAFVSRAENIKVKSFGLLSLLVLPGAFVEPDEKQLKKSSSITKLKIYAAGSFANIIVFAITGLVFLAIFRAFYVPSGVTYEGLAKDSPAVKVNLDGAITAINGVKITTIGDFKNLMSGVSVGQKIEITTTKGIFDLITVAASDDPKRSVIGIENPSDYYAVTTAAGFFAGSIDWLHNLFGFLAFINIGIGLINILPIKPLDGGLVYEELFKMIFKKNMPVLINLLSLITFGILFISAFGPYILKAI